ncbi:unnamed protein product, partial [Vitis vinifera]
MYKNIPIPFCFKKRSCGFEKLGFSLCIVFSVADFETLMAGGNFMHRVISYVVNEVLVNSLANSPAFQRFAVRTSRRMEDISNKAAQKRQELAEQVKELSKNFESPKNQ